MTGEERAEPWLLPFTWSRVQDQNIAAGERDKVKSCLERPDYLQRCGLHAGKACK